MSEQAPQVRKHTHDECEYQNGPNGSMYCSICKFFQQAVFDPIMGEAFACEIVEDPIFQHGWCKFWEQADAP